MNWGYKILTVYLIFVAGIVALVYKSTTQNIDLVTTDYYDKELKYQQKLDAQQRTATLSAAVQYEIKNNQLLLTLPGEFETKQVSGTVLLYCPANKSRDITLNFVTSTKAVAVDLRKDSKGLNELQVTWTADGKEYYYSEKLFL